jgi:hypothetical protein
MALNHPFIHFTKVVFQYFQKADYDFSGPVVYLKQHLSGFIKVAFFDSQDAENDIA